MPANFNHEYVSAVQKYEDAKTLEDKVAGLELMKSTAPAHKGGENLRLDVSKRLAKLKDKLEKDKQKKGGKSGMTVKKEGAAQVVLVGLPNSGKSTILTAITNATPEIASYAFTTTKPEIGAMEYKGAKIQVVEIPALIKGSAMGKAQGREKISIIRNADLVVFCLVGDKNQIKKDYDLLIKEINISGVKINKDKPLIELKKTGVKGLQIAGEHNLRVELDVVKRLLKNYGIYSGQLTLNEPADLNMIENALDMSLSYKKAIGLWVWGNDNFDYKNTQMIGFAPEDIEKIKETIYNNLDLIVIKTRKPGEKDDDNVPIVLKTGGTIEELCSLLHKDFINNFSHARVWGSSKFPGQVVSKDFQLKEKDIVEVYLRNKI